MSVTTLCPHCGANREQRITEMRDQFRIVCLSCEKFIKFAEFTPALQEVADKQREQRAPKGGL